MAFHLTAGRLGKLLIISTILQLTSPSWATDNNKRAPSGFTGVRGKKNDYEDINEIKNERPFPLYSSDDIRQDVFDISGEDATREVFPNTFEMLFKRGPMGFVGMRGKKEMFHKFNSQEILSKEIDKIRFNCKLYPHNFHCNDVVLESNQPFALETRQLNSDEPMDADEDNNDGGRLVPNSDFSRIFETKRAPTGFMGMRGKKYNGDRFNIKRAPSGFVGMRGKKNFMYESSLVPITDDTDQVFTNNAFVSKRAPQAGFFGMRGKKMPGYSGFFGMRGKKGPYDSPFRGKFVGVRGKKSYDDAVVNQVVGANIERE